MRELPSTMMKYRHLTIRVPEALAEKAARAAAVGEADSVSDYFVQLAAKEPDWAAAQEAVDELIRDAGGLSAADLAWARDALSR